MHNEFLLSCIYEVYFIATLFDWDHRYMSQKPVSSLVIPTSSDLPRAGDMGIRDQLKEDWGWLSDNLKRDGWMPTVMGV